MHARERASEHAHVCASVRASVHVCAGACEQTSERACACVRVHAGVGVYVRKCMCGHICMPDMHAIPNPAGKRGYGDDRVVVDLATECLAQCTEHRNAQPGHVYRHAYRHVYRPVYRHVYRRVYRHVYSRVYRCVYRHAYTYRRVTGDMCIQ